LNIEAVQELSGQGAKLIITIDCGITDVLAVEKANRLGLEVIITDHHEPPSPLPAAFAIIDHKQVDCNYPDKNICGSGVAFKLIQAILKLNRFGLKQGHEKWLLDLVGIATLSDMVPLVGENRIFAYYGLSVLRKSPRKGLMQLLRKLKIDQRYLNEDDVAFMITPRINAASRMGLPMDAYNLLVADNEVDANKYTDHLDKINNERKGVVSSLVKEVKKILEERYGNEIPDVIVLGNPEWRPSLLGLVANTCAEEFDRPTFFWGRDGGNIIKGSCRSEGKTSVVELMRSSVPETFLQFGGHKHSGGFAVSNEEIHFFGKKIE
jgi:single-stranded-DNA-specific exonuclease